MPIDSVGFSHAATFLPICQIRKQGVVAVCVAVCEAVCESVRVSVLCECVVVCVCYSVVCV